MALTLNVWHEKSFEIGTRADFEAGRQAKVKVIGTTREKATLLVDAPKDVLIYRSEIADRMRDEGRL